MVYVQSVLAEHEYVHFPETIDDPPLPQNPTSVKDHEYGIKLVVMEAIDDRGECRGS